MNNAASEFSRIVDLRGIDGRPVKLSAAPEERAALARRFGLVRIDRLEASISLLVEGATVRAEGRLLAEIVQSCAVSAEDLPVRIDEPLALVFVPAGRAAAKGAEIEISAEDCDEIEYDNGRFDLGEQVAQSLALAIDPFATGPQADRARKDAGIGDGSESGPFAALSALRKDR